ncbi:MAG: hypothetical protein NTW21_23395 [Verrucomicrobia bacterium]|nr:hypothetical protein [Verrucomicrobiota bacterium]
MTWHSMALQRMFGKNHPAGKPLLFLYDVTSSYLEGQHHAFGCFGYVLGDVRIIEIVVDP